MQWGDNAKARFFYRDREHQCAQLQAAIDHAGPLGGKMVVDIGCGYGDLLGLLPPCAYVGVDPDRYAVAQAQLLWPDHEFHATEAVPKGDVLIAVASLQCIPDKKKALRSWMRKARERVVVVTCRWEHLPESDQDELEWEGIVRDVYVSDDDFVTSVVSTAYTASVLTKEAS